MWENMEEEERRKGGRAGKRKTKEGLSKLGQLWTDAAVMRQPLKRLAGVVQNPSQSDPSDPSTRALAL